MATNGNIQRVICTVSANLAGSSVNEQAKAFTSHSAYKKTEKAKDQVRQNEAAKKGVCERSTVVLFGFRLGDGRDNRAGQAFIGDKSTENIGYGEGNPKRVRAGACAKNRRDNNVSHCTEHTG